MLLESSRERALQRVPAVTSVCVIPLIQIRSGSTRKLPRFLFNAHRHRWLTYVSMGKHFGMLKASDMVQIDEDGQVIGGNRVAINAAGFVIHSAIHRARPDVHAACHMHSPAGKAWSTFGRPIDIINQDSCNFYGIQSVYKDFGGVVLGAEEGQRIVRALGDKSRVIFLQNHGLLTAGGTVDEAAYLFTCLERTCEVQLKVEAAGLPKNFISDKVAEFTSRVNADPVSSRIINHETGRE